MKNDESSNKLVMLDQIDSPHLSNDSVPPVHKIKVLKKKAKKESHIKSLSSPNLTERINHENGRY